MNGYLAQTLMWAINALLGLVVILMSAILKAHKERDDERHADSNAEIKRLRDKMHTVMNDIAALKIKVYLDERK